MRHAGDKILSPVNISVSEHSGSLPVIHFLDAVSHLGVINNRLYEIMQLTDNWDGCGAVPPDVKVTDNAIKFISILPLTFLNDLSGDDITPTPYGTVVFDWRNGEKLISIEIGSEKIGFFTTFNNGNDIESEGINFDDREIPAELMAAFKTFYS